MANTSVGVVVGWMTDTRRALVRVGRGAWVEAAVPPGVETPLRRGTRVTLMRVEGEEPVAWILADPTG
jgi:hypothetical protein